MPSRPAALPPLAVHESAPLSDVAVRFMKVSQNLYAETVFRTLSLAPGPATIAASRQPPEMLSRATASAWRGSIRI